MNGLASSLVSGRFLTNGLVISGFLCRGLLAARFLAVGLLATRLLADGLLATGCLLLDGMCNSNMDLLSVDNLSDKLHGMGSVQKKSWSRALFASNLRLGSNTNSLSNKSMAWG